MSISSYVCHKSYKSQATHSVGALWKVLVITLSCFIPVMVPAKKGDRLHHIPLIPGR